MPASFSAVREVCEHSSWVEDEEFLNRFEEDLMAPDLHQSVPHSVHDMDEQRFSGELRRGDNQQHTDSIVMDMTVNDSDQERDRAHRGNRFAVLDEHQSEDARRGQELSNHGDSGSNTVSIDGVSDVEVAEVVDATAVSEPVVMEPRIRAPVTTFSSMDAVNLTDVFANRARVVCSVLAMLKGAFRSALSGWC